MNRAFCLGAVAAIGCATTPARLPRIELPLAQRCAPVARPSQLDFAESLSASDTHPQKPGEWSVLHRTVVQITDYYYEPRRIDAPAMFVAVAEAFAEVSGGHLRVDGDLLVAKDGGALRLHASEVRSIWNLPESVQSLSAFAAKHLPAGQRLTDTRFAEALATNAVLSTLDPESLYVPAGAVPPGGRRDAPGELTTFSLKTLPNGVARVRIDDLGPGVSLPPSASQVGIVLDLRGSHAGSGDAIVPLLDLFLSSGTMLTLNARYRAARFEAKDNGLPSERAKLVVLVGPETGGPAEAVAGALRFSGRALLVGQRTAGRGIVDASYTFDGALLRLGVAEALLPGDLRFDEVGIAPDVALAVDQPRACAPLGETAVTLESGPGSDAALDAAARIVAAARSASREDLLEAARALR
jgi:hypothetical protein